jgi:hypothetical protein
VKPEAPQQSLPIEPLPQGKNEMGHVGAVKALPLHNKRLGPDGLFNRRDLHRYAEDLTPLGILKPPVVHLGHAVPRAEDDVDEPLG